MLLKDVMTREVEVIRPGASLHEAAEKMKKLDVGPLPVCDGESLVGMVTDRDITVRATAEGRNPLPGSVGTFYWTGAWGTTFFVDPQEKLIALQMIQVPATASSARTSPWLGRPSSRCSRRATG